jgi:hypothetical protein
MKIAAEKRLFWSLREGAEIDLSKRSQLDMYVQQVLSRGRLPDIQFLLAKIDRQDFTNSFRRIKRFLPGPVKRFWEEWLGDPNPSSKRNP